MIKEGQKPYKKLGCDECSRGRKYVIEIAYIIQNQLQRPNVTIFYSWGAHNWQAMVTEDEEGTKMPSLQFKVNGIKFKGYVRISYTPMDYYNVEFISTRGNLKQFYQDVDAFQLQEMIDEFVEKIADYKF